MDDLVENSSEVFSPAYVNVTLTLMCGIHNCTKNLTVQNLNSFVMIGASNLKEYVIISFSANTSIPSCTTLSFFSVNFVNITTLIMQCPSINLIGGHVSVINSKLYGYTGIEKALSSIMIAGRNSSALLNDCILTENCFITSNVSGGIIVNNSTFHSYRHKLSAIILAVSSVVTLTGYVNFTDGIMGNSVPHVYSNARALTLLTSTLDITAGTTVFFANISCINH